MYQKRHPAFQADRIAYSLAMIALLSFLLAVLASPFRSNSSLLAENALLRHQVLVLRRKFKGPVPLSNGDRWFFVQLYRWFPSIFSCLVVVRSETLIRWHRAGFRRYWRWKSRSQGGLPRIDPDLRALIRAERLIGSIRRECLDRVIVLGEGHLRRVLREYARYYNTTRAHWSSDKDAPLSRPIQRVGRTTSQATLSGLHHRYVRT